MANLGDALIKDCSTHGQSIHIIAHGPKGLFFICKQCYEKGSQNVTESVPGETEIIKQRYPHDN